MSDLCEKIGEICQAAEPYQDMRDDKGHAQTVASATRELLKRISGADEFVVLAASTLHDIGWSQLSEDERFKIFRKGITKEKELAGDGDEVVDARVKHEKEGVKLAERILEEIGITREKIDRVVEIIGQHDTGRGVLNLEDSIVKDADKLWTFTIQGVLADVRRFGYEIDKVIGMARKRVDLPGYFNNEQARQMAREFLSSL